MHQKTGKTTSDAEMLIAGIEVPAAAIGELARRLYQAGNIGLALQFCENGGYPLELAPEDRGAIIRALGTPPPAGLEELHDALLQTHTSRQYERLV